jgi:hypothetical protein
LRAMRVGCSMVARRKRHGFNFLDTKSDEASGKRN